MAVSEGCRILPCAYDMLYCFSGPGDRSESFGAHMRRAGAQVSEYDLLIGGESMDLLCDFTWEQVISRIQTRGFRGGALFVPPRSSFTQVLRTGDGPGRYGVQELDDDQRKRVRMGTALALRACDGAMRCHSLGLPWLIALPMLSPTMPSALQLDEYRSLARAGGIALVHGYPFCFQPGDEQESSVVAPVCATRGDKQTRTTLDRRQQPRSPKHSSRLCLRLGQCGFGDAVCQAEPFW